MSFNVEKCKVVHYGKGSTNFTYKMHATSEKDLGVVFSNDLKVKQQCEEAYKRASQILGLIHRTIQFRNPSVLITLSDFTFWISLFAESFRSVQRLI